MSRSDTVVERACSYCSLSFGSALLVLLAIGLGFTSIFIVHGLSFWLSTDPERAFHLARELVGIYSTVWNSVREIYNGALFVATAWVPGYNFWSKHVVEPTVFIALDVASLVFAHKHYAGVVTQEQLPFLGHYCGDPAQRGVQLPSEQTMKWCAFQSSEVWAHELGATQSSDGASAVRNGTTLLLSTAHTRRLAEALRADENAEGASLFPTLHLAPLVEAVTEITGAITMLYAIYYDIVAHVVFTILSEIAVLIWNMLQILVRAVLAAVLAIVRSGALQTIIRVGVDLLMTLVIYVGIPILLATLDVILCLINMIQPGTWPEQVACVERTCFKADGDIGAEIFTTFSSIPIISHVMNEAIQALLNPTTGRKFGESAGGSTDIPEIDPGASATGAATTCAACFVCRVPEIRVIWLLVAMTYGCVKDETRYAGRVEEACLDGGQFYLDACGPRSAFAHAMDQSEWELTYTSHRQFDIGRVNHYAGLFHQLAEDSGGATSNGYYAQIIADLWKKRNVADELNMAAPFFRGVCTQMRLNFDIDTGPSHVNVSKGSMGYLSAAFLYESCKGERFELCTNDFAQSAVDTWYELSNCMFDMPSCRRDREVCLGRCGGNSTEVQQDFMTDAAKVELSERVLGTDVISRSRANCTIRNYTIEIPLFPGIDGLAFVKYASRLRVRGGALAIDPRACSRHPESCGAVVRVLERDPTLTFRNGRFIPAHSLESPQPPPPPAPPPFLDVYQRREPPPPPRPPRPPPPWYSHAETCTPIITPAEAQIDVDEERAVCVYSRAIQDERVRAEKCFRSMPPSPPPPPPTPRARNAAINSELLKAKVRKGGSTSQEPVTELTSEQEYRREHQKLQRSQLELLDRLATDNFQLRELIGGVRDRIIGLGGYEDEDIVGRRLWEREATHKSHMFLDNVLSTSAFGNRPIVGITMGQCQGLCRAITNDTTGACVGIAFARANANPRDLTLRQCYLLHQTGGCSPASFSAALWSRRDTDSCTVPSFRDNPMCIQLSPYSTNLRVLDFESAKSACAAGGKGRYSPKLPLPRSALEAFSMLAYARERGIHSFWSDRPSNGMMFWSGVDGQPVNIPNGDRRCVLVSTVDSDIHGHMFAELKPCTVRMADGLVCESASAAPPPPPWYDATHPPSPFPPPPLPIAITASLRFYTRKTVAPLTEAICLAGLTARDVGHLCTEFAKRLSTPVKEGAVPTFTPLCRDVCFHSCEGATDQDHDGYQNCREPSCADTSCGEFLLRECPPQTHAAIHRLVEASCSLGSPMPPPTPSPNPRPPPQPQPPPPFGSTFGNMRVARDEKPTDPDCKLVTYEACRRAAIEVGIHFGTSTDLEINLAPCEKGVDTSSCFIGCSLGSLTGAPSLYTYLTPEKLEHFGAYNSYRCASSAHEHCLCASTPPPPPPPPLFDDETRFLYASASVATDSIGHSTAFYKKVASDAAMPESFVSNKIQYDCPGSDSGALHCARHCSNALGPELVAFSVHGMVAPPPPYSPSSPPTPPVPPPTPSPPQGFQFHGATDSCYKANIYAGTECRDGGVGSIYPPYCQYGTQHQYCGPRPYIANGALMGDNSCEHARNNLCEDGGPGSEPQMYFEPDGTARSICGYATDQDDCPLRFMETLGSLSYGNADHPPAPTPPPSPPTFESPPPPPPPFTSCANTCQPPFIFCSDGGLGSKTNNGIFVCSYGTQCSICGVRLNTKFTEHDDSSQEARDGVCRDVAVVGDDGVGYGTDTTDCGGPRQIVQSTGPPITGRRMSETPFNNPPPDSKSPPPPPPRPPPPPTPSPPTDLWMCECKCTHDTNHESQDWSDISIVARSVPEEDTRLYTARAIVERGAEQIVPGIVRLQTNNIKSTSDAFVSSPMFSRPVAHVINGWKLPQRSGYTKTIPFVDPSKQEEILCATESSNGWTDDNGKQCGHWMGRCNNDVLITNCPLCCRAPMPSNNHPVGELSPSPPDSVISSLGRPPSNPPPYPPPPPLPPRPPQQTTFLPYCISSCAHDTAHSTFNLHYVEVDTHAQECTCGYGDSPEPPDNSAVTALIMMGGRSTTPSDTRIYTIGPPRRSYVEIVYTDNDQQPGTLYFEQAFEYGIGVADVWLGQVTKPLVNAITTIPSGSTEHDCARKCIQQHVRVAIKGFQLDSRYGICTCLGEDPMSLHNHQYLYHSHERNHSTTLYSAWWCRGIMQGENDGRFVYDFRLKQWCPGYVGGHMGEAVIGGEVMSSNQDAALSCMESCDYRNGTTISSGCNMIEIMTTAWSDIIGSPIERPDPPPYLPYPPSPPPPQYPPLPPNPPLSNTGNLLRAWYPLGNELPLKEEDEQYSITCQLPSSCNSSALPIYTGPFISTVQLARELEQTGAYEDALCPWECAPKLVGHWLSPSDARSFFSGHGFAGLAFPGRESGGFTNFTSFNTNVLEPIKTLTGVSKDDCAMLMTGGGDSGDGPFHGSLIYGSLAIWASTYSEVTHTHGDCITFRATRDSIQARLWRSFVEYANVVLDTPFYQPTESTAKVVPLEFSSNCLSLQCAYVWWSEWNDDTYSCKPTLQTMENILTPIRLISELAESGVSYPPPTPPPPSSPSPPHPPPIEATSCMNDEIPIFTGTLLDEKCYKWISDTGTGSYWPPENVHRNVYEVDPQCPSSPYTTRSVQREQFRMFNKDSLVRTAIERLSPSGSVYVDCQVALPETCCIAHHQVHKTGMDNLPESGCKARCGLERRNGNDRSCLPAYPECLQNQSDASLFIETFCLCGARYTAAAFSLSNLASPPPPPLPPVPPSFSRRGRELGFRPLTGGHLQANDTCRADLNLFKLRWMPFQLGACDLDALNPRILNSGSFGSCSESTDEDKRSCCTTTRHSLHRTEVYKSLGNGQFDSNPTYVGTDVFGSSDAALAVGDLNLDGHSDLIIGNKIFMSTDGNGFRSTPLYLGNQNWAKLHVVDFDGPTSYPDIAAVSNEGVAYVIRSKIKRTAEQNIKFTAYWHMNASYEDSKQIPLFHTLAFFEQNDTRFRDGDDVKITGINYGVRTQPSSCQIVNKTFTIHDWYSFDSYPERGYMSFIYPPQTDRWPDNMYPTPARSFLHRSRPRHMRGFALTLPTDLNCIFYDIDSASFQEDDAFYERPIFTFEGVPRVIGTEIRPPGGIDPTFYPPQRIGDVSDSGVIDIAIVDVCTDTTGELDSQVDACLLFRGRPIKCFVLPTYDLRVYDTSTSLAVVSPAQDDDMSDAISFAEIDGASLQREVTANIWDMGPTSRHDTTPQTTISSHTAASKLTADTKDTGIPHGLQKGTTIEIINWNMNMDIEYHTAPSSNKFVVSTSGSTAFSFYLPVTFLWATDGTNYWRPASDCISNRDETTSRYPKARDSITYKTKAAAGADIKCVNMAPRCAPGTHAAMCGDASKSIWKSTPTITHDNTCQRIDTRCSETPERAHDYSDPEVEQPQTTTEAIDKGWDDEESLNNCKKDNICSDQWISKSTYPSVGCGSENEIGCLPPPPPAFSGRRLGMKRREDWVSLSTVNLDNNMASVNVTANAWSPPYQPTRSENMSGQNATSNVSMRIYEGEFDYVYYDTKFHREDEFDWFFNGCPKIYTTPLVPVPIQGFGIDGSYLGFKQEKLHMNTVYSYLGGDSLLTTLTYPNIDFTLWDILPRNPHCGPWEAWNDPRYDEAFELWENLPDYDSRKPTATKCWCGCFVYRQNSIDYSKTDFGYKYQSTRTEGDGYSFPNSIYLDTGSYDAYTLNHFLLTNYPAGTYSHRRPILHPHYYVYDQELANKFLFELEVMCGHKPPPPSPPMPPPLPPYPPPPSPSPPPPSPLPPPPRPPPPPPPPLPSPPPPPYMPPPPPFGQECGVGHDYDDCGRQKRYLIFGGRTRSMLQAMHDADRSKSYAGMGPLKVRVVDTPRRTNSGSVNVGEDRPSNTPALVVIRRDSQPTVVKAEPGLTGHPIGASSIGSSASGAVGTTNQDGTIVAIANSNAKPEVWYGTGRAATRDKVILEGAPSTDISLCKTTSPVQDSYEIATGGGGESPRIFYGNGWQSVQVLGPTFQNTSATPPPLTSSIRCAKLLGNDNKEDVIVHRTTRHPASCAYRCYEQGRFSYDSYWLANVANADIHDHCLCGPSLSLAVGPPVPPFPPSSPQTPPLEPQPSVPPSPPPPQSPPPPPPIHRAGLCIRYGDADFISPSPPPPPPTPPSPYVEPPPAPSPMPPAPPCPRPPPSPPPRPPPPPPGGPPPPPPPLPPPSPPRPPPPPNSPPPMPNIPPILDTPSSRMIYHDLTTDTTELLAHEESAWQVVSAALLESYTGYPDTTLVQGIWLQDTHCADKVSMFDSGSSRSLVSFGTLRGRENCVEYDPDHSITLFYRDPICLSGRNQYEEYTHHRPSQFEPKCVVVLLEASSRMELRDELVKAGRSMIDPLRLVVNYTTTLSVNPNLQVTSANCALGHLFKKLYEADLAQQEQRDELQKAQIDLDEARSQSTLFDRTLDGLSAFRPPAVPPSPAPPRAPGAPQVPLAVPFEVRSQQLQDRVDMLTKKVSQLDASIQLCTPSTTQTCGRSSIMAPNPWLASNGQKCYGYDTYEALEFAFCGYWSSTRNVYAAESEEAAEMLSKDGAPYCFDDSTPPNALKCPVSADRTHRAGVYELRERRRIDRPYCESDIFKQMTLDNATASEAECRKIIREQERACQHSVCRQCTSPCIYPVMRTVGAVLKCTSPTRHYGMVHYAHTSDAGQLARSLHGARRENNYGPVPERYAAHLYHIAHNNPSGLLQRDSISCRKEHVNSPSAHFAHGFDTDGRISARSGYMVSCMHHSDCMPCGRHPLTGQHYRCQKRYTLYDTVYTTDDGDISFINITDASANAFDIDMEAGAITGKTGICVDLDSSMNEGCNVRPAAAIKDGLIGCFDYYSSKFLCGLSVEVKHGDLSTVQTTGNIIWPRVLVEGSEDADGDGRAIGRLECGDPIDCMQKCRLLERRSLQGAGAPPTCAL